ncbi:MAG: acyl-CoA dehydrogenase family protein [Deltaproteobacteria bacterium]|jgi:alkylation response protein AidB-like acyl-CoA dehydrogenase|nr:acyl-CoA dehydrogenase family protein [Deltaproteobacteria bacterium]
MVLTQQQEMIRESAARFAEQRLAPNSRSWEAAGAVDAAVLREMGELGFMGMTVPEKYDGAGLDYVSYALALIEIAAGDGAVSTIMSVNNAPVCAILQSVGSEALRQKYLRPLASGEMIGAFALTEPQAGSDAANLQTRAVLKDGGYEITGTKQFITSGRIAGAVIVFAVTDPAGGKRGMSAFLVPAGTPGMSVASLEHKMGQEASDTAQLSFDGARIPEDHLIGKEGDGYRIALANLEAGRIGIAAQCVGMARAALGHALAYSKERTAFGKMISDHQAVAFRLADMATELHAAETMVLHAAALRDAESPCLKEACMAKLFASEAAERICSDAIQIFGGYGYSRELPVEKIYRDVRVAQIYEGTSDVQRIIISRQLLRGG